MSSLFSFVFLGAVVFAIVFLRKSSKLKKRGEDNSKAKKNGLMSIGVAVIAFIVVGVTAPSTEENNVSEEENTETVASSSEEEVNEDDTAKAENVDDTTKTENEATDFEVTVDASAHKDGKAVVFDIETNLPDETELMLTLSKGDYSKDNAVRAQTKVIITDGKATSEGFTNKGEALNGDFDLDISMSLPSLQSDAVQAVIGKKGEHMKGNLVDTSSIGSANTVDAMFNVSIGDEISITASDDYKNTVFNDEEEDIATDSTDSEDTTTDNKEFISQHETEIVAVANMSLDRFISDYKLSLAPQNWTIAKFDSSETTVMAMTDITYKSVKGKYIYVGTLDVNSSGKVEGATPHYLEVNGVVLGNDGYCDEVFDKLKSLTN